MHYVFLIATALASIYTYTFAQYLKKEGNKAGFLGIYALIICSMAVAIYRVMQE